MIQVEDLHMHFGGIRAVDGVSLAIEGGRITGLIGPNGAGKPPLFNIIAGAYKPTSGKVFLDGADITGLPPHDLFAKGMLRTFQIAHEFSTLTVRENLMMVPGRQSGERLLEAWLRPTKIRQEEIQVRRNADEVIEFLQLGEVANELAGNLSGGQKKLLVLKQIPKYRKLASSIFFMPRDGKIMPLPVISLLCTMTTTVKQS